MSVSVDKIIKAALAWHEDVKLDMEACPDIPHCESLTADNLFKAVALYKEEKGKS